MTDKIVISYAYIRVSSKTQSLDRQVTGVKNYRPDIPDINIFSDKITGKSDADSRDGYNALKTIINYQLQVRGDNVTIEIILHELDRLGRNKQNIKDEIDYWKSKGVIVRILELPTTLTEVPDELVLLYDMVSALLIEVYSTMAERELETRYKRQMEGIAEAQAKNVKFGRPAKKYDENLFNYLYPKWKNGEITTKTFRTKLGLTPNTFYRRIHDYEEGLKSA